MYKGKGAKRSEKTKKTELRNSSRRENSSVEFGVQTPPPLFPVELPRRRYGVLCHIEKGETASSISRLEKLSKSTVSGHLKRLSDDKYILKQGRKYVITQKGKNILKLVRVGGKAPNYFNVHKNNFKIDIEKFPNDWINVSRFLHLNEKNFYNNSTGTLYCYLENVTVVFSTYAKRASFWIGEIKGHSFEKILNDVWGEFVLAVELFEKEGFKFSRIVNSDSQHFASKKGLFATMATKINSRGYEVETKLGKFWVDFSKPERKAEEETDSEKLAERLEHLTKTAFSSNSDFHDIDELKKLNASLVGVVAQLARIVLKENDR